MLARVENLTKALGIPYIPVTPTFPLFGPIGLIPAPTKWKIESKCSDDVNVRASLTPPPARIFLRDLSLTVFSSVAIRAPATAPVFL